MNAEKIILISVKALNSFICQYFGEVREIHYYIDAWDETWPKIRDWLIKTDKSIFLDKKEAIRNFITKILFSEEYYEKIKHLLVNSFAIHDNFWNQFFTNILEAKSKL